jgi:predicted SAM-dependent methyltransferase
MILNSLFFRCRNIFKFISTYFDNLYQKSISIPFDSKAKEIIADYLKKAEVKKLHLGCGNNIFDGWLNTDILAGEKIAYLDVTKKYQLPSNSFDFIFTEHMIEHITIEQSELMLAECFRVLKPFGIIRISTPDLAKIIGMYNQNLDTEKQKYLDWVKQNYFPNRNYELHNQYINNYFHNWGHKFIFDFETIKSLLEKIGFTNIIEVPIYKSTSAELNNLEMHHEVISVEYNLLESFAVEATK